MPQRMVFTDERLWYCDEAMVPVDRVAVDRVLEEDVDSEVGSLGTMLATMRDYEVTK